MSGAAHSQVSGDPQRLSSLRRWLPALDVGLAVLALLIWIVRPQAGLWPLAIIALGWLLRFSVYRSLTRSTPLALPLLLFVLSAYVAASIAYNQGASWIEADVKVMWSWAKFWQIVAAVALFFAIANVRDFQPLWAWLRVYAALAVGVALYFLLTHDWNGAVKFDLINQLGARLTSGLPHPDWPALQPNVAGGMIAMIVPYGIVLWRDAHARRRHGEWLLWSALGALALLGLFLSASRGAWLALGIMLLLWLLLRAYGAQRSARARVVLLFVSVAALLAAGAALSVLPNILLSADGDVSRAEVFRSAWPLAQDYFFTGAGLATFPLLYSTYVLLIPVVFLPNAHNVFLDILIEQGIVGLAAYVSALLAFVWLAWRGLRALHAQKDATVRVVRARWLLEAALVSQAVALVHGMVEDVPYDSLALGLLFVSPAIASALQRYFPFTGWPLSIRGAAVTAALVALAVLWQRQTIVSYLYANFGALNQAQLELSDYRWPDQLPSDLRRSANFSDVFADYDRALTFDAANRTAHQRLAAIALERDAYDAAVRYAEAAYAQARDSATSWQLLGDAYLAQGRSDEAFVWWSRVPDAENKLRALAAARYERAGDTQRAQWARTLADRIRAARHPG